MILIANDVVIPRPPAEHKWQ